MPSLPVREPCVSEVRSELQSVLNSRVFRSSRVTAKLLRYLCSKVLTEDAGSITEYTIAVDVLGKPQDFKDNKDATVRVEVYRLRKRLAEYYAAEGATHRIRIIIPTGQYVPHFVFWDENDAGAVAADGPQAIPLNGVLPHVDPCDAPAVLPAVTSAAKITGSNGAGPPEIPANPSASLSRLRYRRLRLAVPAALAAVLVIAAPVGLTWFRDRPLDVFWRPMLSSTTPILLCIGTVEGGQRPKPVNPMPPDLTVRQFHALASEMTLVDDAATLSGLAGLLQSKGRRYRVISQSEATFADLRSTPAVLIGLANNDWTERLVGQLRFSLEHRPARLTLRDRLDPAREDWSLDYSMPYLAVTRDYALVVRVLDPKTGQMVVTAAGLSVFGTRAAGEFLTNPQEFRKIEKVAPRGWKDKNFEMVISTEVIRGKSGRPEIAAAHFW